MALTSYLTVIFVMSFFAVSKLFGPKIPKTNSWINEFIRELFTMPNFFWGTLFIVMSIGFMLNKLFGPEAWRYYQYVVAVVCAFMCHAIARQTLRAQKKQRTKKRRIIRTL